MSLATVGKARLVFKGEKPTAENLIPQLFPREGANHQQVGKQPTTVHSPRRRTTAPLTKGCSNPGQGATTRQMHHTDSGDSDRQNNHCDWAITCPNRETEIPLAMPCSATAGAIAFPMPSAPNPNNHYSGVNSPPPGEFDEFWQIARSLLTPPFAPLAG